MLTGMHPTNRLPTDACGNAQHQQMHTYTHTSNRCIQEQISKIDPCGNISCKQMLVGTHLTNQQMCVGAHIANPCLWESEIRNKIWKSMSSSRNALHTRKHVPDLPKILFLYISINVFPDLAIIFVNHEHSLVYLLEWSYLANDPLDYKWSYLPMPTDPLDRISSSVDLSLQLLTLQLLDLLTAELHKIFQPFILLFDALTFLLNLPFSLVLSLILFHVPVIWYSFWCLFHFVSRNAACKSCLCVFLPVY